MLSLRIALRYLFARKSHTAVNIISLVSVAGVAVATLAIVCVLSVFNGFADLASARLSLLDPEIMVTPSSGKTIRDAGKLAENIGRLPHVDLALPTITDNALAIYSGKQMPVTIKGVPSGYERLTNLSNAVIDGEYMLEDSEGLPTAALSVGTAIRMEANPGYYDWFKLYVPRRIGRINPANPMSAFRSDSLVVSAVWQVDQAEYDTDVVYIPFDIAEKLLDYSDEASAIEILARPGESEKAIAEIKSFLGDNYKIENRLQQQEQSFRMIEIEKWITFLMLAFILTIAAFNIISTISMLIIEKEDNIATLSALGATKKMISRIFLWEGWLISVFGGCIGLIAGVGLCLIQQLCGIVKLNGDPSQLSVSVYPVSVEWGDLLVVFVLVASVGYAVGLMAHRFVASRMRSSISFV